MKIIKLFSIFLLSMGMLSSSVYAQEIGKKKFVQSIRQGITLYEPRRSSDGQIIPSPASTAVLRVRPGQIFEVEYIGNMYWKCHSDLHDIDMISLLGFTETRTIEDPELANPTQLLDNGKKYYREKYESEYVSLGDRPEMTETVEFTSWGDRKTRNGKPYAVMTIETVTKANTPHPIKTTKRYIGNPEQFNLVFIIEAGKDDTIDPIIVWPGTNEWDYNWEGPLNIVYIGDNIYTAL